MEKIGGWTKRPLAAGACSLCGNEGIGNLGLWLCERHISTIAREHGYLLEATLREQIAREQAEYLSHWQDFYLDTYPDDVVDCVGRDLIAIARGK